MDGQQTRGGSPAPPTRSGVNGWLATLRSFAGRLELYDFGRWLTLASATGVVTGLGAAFLSFAVDLVSSGALLRVVGYLPPGYGHPLATAWHPPARPWLFLLVLPLAGLAVGWLVQRFAPEAEGHGTDAVIRAFHRERAVIRRRVPLVKLLASALTIGSGGSAGREGPVAQVGAGFGSYLANLLGLSPGDRRTLVIAGMAGGIGGMFRAPLGGALFAIEVLYAKNDFESESLIPAVISSTVSFVVVNTLTGWEEIFSPPPIAFTRPRELLAYLVLAVTLALVGAVYVKVFYGMRDRVFGRLPVPVWVRPAIGAAVVALIALVLPQVLGGGYGWIQLTLDGRLPLLMLAALVPAKIVATACTISSGGSGGVFAPSLIIGGMTGAVFAGVGQRLAPAIMPEPAACVLVGMGGLFSGVANVPIASLVLVAEMSGSYRLLVPMMLVGSATYLLLRGVSIYEQQVPGRVDSPAHLGEFRVDVLERLPVRGITRTDRCQAIEAGMPYRRLLDAVSGSSEDCFPIVDRERNLVGIVFMGDVQRVVNTPEVWPVLVASDLASGVEATGFLLPDDSLAAAARLLATSQHHVVPVLAGAPPAQLLGMVTYQDVLRAYDEAVRLAVDEASHG